MPTPHLRLHADLLLARDLPLDEAGAIVRVGIERWTQAWTEVLVTIDVLRGRTSPEGRTLADALTAEFCETLLAEEAPASALLGPTAELVRHGTPRVEALIERVVGAAEAGDAHSVADLFVETKVPRGAKEALGRWLLDYGSAELRAGYRLWDTLALLELFVELQDVEATKRALDLALRNEFPLAAGSHGPVVMRALEMIQAGEPTDLLEAVIEKAGERGVHDLATAFGNAGPSHSSHAAIQRVLALGRLTAAAQTQWWFLLMETGNATVDRIAVPCIAPALGALSSLSEGLNFRNQKLTAPVADGQLRGWAAAVARSFVGAPSDGLARTNFALAIARREDVRQGAAKGFLAAMDDEPDGELATEVRAVLARSQGAGALKAVLLLVTSLDRQPSVAGARPDFGAVGRDLMRLLTTNWGTRVGGYDLGAAAGWVRRAAIEELDESTPIARDGETLRVRQAALQGIVDLHLPPEERTALIGLFVIHELVHFGQGIGAKSTVTELRSHGLAGESTLMHLDLGADHVAACALAHARYPGQLPWLKDLQARSLQAFPVGPQHGHGSRHRKSMRLVGLRADLLARQRGHLGTSMAEGSYAFCDVGSKEAFVLVSGPPMRVLASFALQPNDVATLENAAARDQGLHDVDEVLRRGLDTGS